MEWTLFALSQMALITIGVSVLFTLHNRRLSQQNAQLRAQLEDPSPANLSADAWVQDYLANLDRALPHAALLAAVVQNAAQPDPEFSKQLPELVAQAGFADADSSSDELATCQARIAELQGELQAAQVAAANVDDLAEGAQSEELRTLLKQFTSDSRDMMVCIQTLEAENADLLKQLQAGGASTTQDGEEVPVLENAEPGGGDEPVADNNAPADDAAVAEPA